MSYHNEKESIQVLIKDNLTSLVGHHLYETITPLQGFEVEGPYGNMTLKEIPSSITFLAGGSGIAPFMSMIRYLKSNYPAVSLHLFYSTKTKAEIAFYEELQALHVSHELSYVHTLTQESWRGQHGMINKEFLERNGLVRDGIFFICGPSQMVKDLSLVLRELGIKGESIIFEKY